MSLIQELTPHCVCHAVVRRCRKRRPDARPPSACVSFTSAAGPPSSGRCGYKSSYTDCSAKRRKREACSGTSLPDRPLLHLCECVCVYPNLCHNSGDQVCLCVFACVCACVFGGVERFPYQFPEVGDAFSRTHYTSVAFLFRMPIFFLAPRVRKRSVQHQVRSCLCACVCVCMRMRVCVRVCVCVARSISLKSLYSGLIWKHSVQYPGEGGHPGR